MFRDEKKERKKRSEGEKCPVHVKLFDIKDHSFLFLFFGQMKLWHTFKTFSPATSIIPLIVLTQISLNGKMASVSYLFVCACTK